MNKFAKVICMIAVVALAFTSCKKNETERAFVKDVTTQEFVQQYDEEWGEKAYFNGSWIEFEENDAFLLFAYSPTNPTNGYQNGYTWYKYTHWGTIPYLVWVEQLGFGLSNPDNDYIPYSDAWYAFYPAQNVSDINLEGEHGKATFTVSPTQTYRANRVPENAMYMACKDDTHKDVLQTQLAFQNICGVLGIRLYSPSGRVVKSIQVTDHAFNIAGDVRCNFDQIVSDQLMSWCTNYQYTNDYNDAMYAWLRENLGYELVGNNTSRTITLDCGTNGVALGTSPSNPTQFYIVLRPLALVKGCDIKVTFMGGPAWEISSEKDNRIMPNVIKNLAVYNVG